MSLYQIYLIIHILGVVVGAGAAFFSDAVFLQSSKDKKISKEERAIMHLGTKVVWVGLLFMGLSGVGLFSLNPGVYIASHSFLAKMTIVGILVLNGLVFTFIHHKEIMRRSHKQARGPRPNYFLPVSGVLSSASWLSVLLLALVKPEVAYPHLMALYMAVLLVGFISTPLLLKRILHVYERKLLSRAAVVAAVLLLFFFLLGRLLFQT